VSVLIVVDGEPGWNAIPVVLLMGVSLLFTVRQLHTDLLDGLMSRFGLENAAGEDKLTHLANRRRFDIVLEQEWSRARRSGLPISLIMVDVNFFKKFNDCYGHQEGDHCLAQVAQALSQSAKRSIDLVARYGGEEFVILLSQTTRDDAYEICERMRNSVESLNIPHQNSHLGCVTISLGGVTLYAREDMKAVELVRTADKALYRAKATGRNRVVWYEPGLDEGDEV
jgi:diguanylate cyclase (GGDEF)-like protein